MCNHCDAITRGVNVSMKTPLLNKTISPNACPAHLPLYNLFYTGVTQIHCTISHFHVSLSFYAQPINPQLDSDIACTTKTFKIPTTVNKDLVTFSL